MDILKIFVGFFYFFLRKCNLSYAYTLLTVYDGEVNESINLIIPYLITLEIGELDAFGIKRMIERFYEEYEHTGHTFAYILQRIVSLYMDYRIGNSMDVSKILTFENVKNIKDLFFSKILFC